MSVLLRLFVLLALAISDVFSNCPEGFIDSFDGSRCYKTIATPASWFDAEKQCSSLGGHLTSVKNTFTNNYLRGIAEAAFGTDTTFWIGAIKWPAPINWTWSDYSDMSYTNWAPSRLNFFVANFKSFRPTSK